MTDAARAERDGVLPLAVLAVLFLEHALIGCNRTDLALGAAIVQLLLLIGAAAAWPRRLAAPAWPAMAAFAVVMAAGIFQLLPIPGLVHPLWLYVSAPPAISLDPFATRVELVKLMAVAASFLLGAMIGQGRGATDRFFLALALAAIAYCLIAFFGFLISPTTLFGQPRAYHGDRLAASFLSANTAATLFGSFILLSAGALYRVLLSRDRRRRLSRAAPYALALALALLCLVMTGSRGGLASTLISAVALLALALWTRGGKTNPWAGLGAAAGLILAAAGAVLLLSGRLVVDRMANLSDGWDFRAALLRDHWAMVKDSPWFGYGLGSFSQLNRLAMPAHDAVMLSMAGATHNVYLQWLTEAGAVGALAMLACVAALALKIAAGALKPTSEGAWRLAVLAVLLLFGLHGAIDYALQVPSMAFYLAVVLGVGYGVAARRGAA